MLEPKKRLFPRLRKAGHHCWDVYAELEHYGRADIMRKTEHIFDTTLEILQMSDRQDITPHQAAFNVAQQRIDARKGDK